MSGYVRVEQGEALVELLDEAVIGRARRADLRSEEEGVPRFFAVLVSEGETFRLRAASDVPLLIRVGAALTSCRSVRVELDQEWIVGSATWRVTGILRPDGPDPVTRVAGVRWHLIAERMHVHNGGRSVSVPPTGTRLLTLLLQQHGEWVSESEVLTVIWPSDAKIADRVAATNNLNVTLHDVRKRLASIGLKDVLLGNESPPRQRTHLRVVKGPRDLFHSR